MGLNIDFAGPHAGARPLLEKAGVETMLVEADARKMPFDEGTFDSASCFLGLQDIKIGFGSEGVRQSVCEALRVLRPGGTLVLIDKYAYRQYDLWFSGLPAEIIDRRKRRLDVCWNREVAMAAIKLYARGWVAQMRLPPADEKDQEAAYREVLCRMESEVESQLKIKGCYVPFRPATMVVARKAI